MTRLRFALVAAVALCASPAYAFYFPDWPNAVRAPQPSLLVSTTPNGEPPTKRPPTDVLEPPEGPQNIPEPATLALGAVGIGLVALRKWRCAR